MKNIKHSNEDELKVSIIIPAYNAESTIDRCVDSILSQTYRNIEVIVVDDGSTDNTGQIVISRTDKRVTLIRQENAGIGAARNAGIRRSKGDYVMFADADDKYSPNMIEVMVASSVRSGADVVRCGIKETYANKQVEKDLGVLGGRMLSLSNRGHLSELIESFFGDKATNKCYVMALLVKRDIIAEHNVWFDEKICMMEDVVFYADLFKTCSSVLFINEPLYCYYCNFGSVSHGIKHLENNIKAVLAVNAEMRKRFKNITSINNAHFKIIIGMLSKLRAKDGGVDYDNKIASLARRTDFKRDNLYWKLIRNAFIKDNKLIIDMLLHINEIVLRHKQKNALIGDK